MQEKLIDILSRATAWMTAPQIADAGGWRSASNVTVALQQMEKAHGQVERRKSPTETMGNGLPATEWKLTDKKINDATESKMGRKPKFPPLEPVAANVVATNAASEVATLRKEIANLKAIMAAAESEYRQTQEQTTELRRLLSDLTAENTAFCSLIEDQRIQINALNDQLMHGSEEAAEVKDAAFFAVHRPRRGLQRFKKLETAKAEAEVGARVEGQAELYAMFLVDVASKGAVWKGKAAA